MNIIGIKWKRNNAGIIKYFADGFLHKSVLENTGFYLVHWVRTTVLTWKECFNLPE